jgi:DNA-binding FadR family transcriptional regulator
MKGFPKSRPADKVEQAVSVLQEYIIDGKLEPGTELPPESEMAKQIGVSKFSMREALRVAQSQGLVEISQGRRTKVAGVSLKPAAGIMNLILRRSQHLLLELTEARQSLEVSIVRFATLRATEDQIKSMEQTIKDMDQNREDLDYCVDKDIEFHDILVESTRNRVFKLMLEPLAKLLRDSRIKTWRISGVDKAISEHQWVLDAIKSRDANFAAETMAEHLQTAESNLKEIEDK